MKGLILRSTFSILAIYFIAFSRLSHSISNSITHSFYWHCFTQWCFDFHLYLLFYLHCISIDMYFIFIYISYIFLTKLSAKLVNLGLIISKQDAVNTSICKASRPLLRNIGIRSYSCKNSADTTPEPPLHLNYFFNLWHRTHSTPEGDFSGYNCRNVTPDPSGASQPGGGFSTVIVISCNMKGV